jgi:subtilase family serine protease
MKVRSLYFAVALAVLLVAAWPVAAQSHAGYVHPPYKHFLSSGSVVPAAAIYPRKMRTAYGFNVIKNYGQGQTIGIVNAYDDPNIESDLGTFSTAFGLPACTTANGCFQKIMPAGTPKDTSGWTNEIAIDVEWAHSIAPKARILLSEAKSNSFADMYAAVDAAVANGASVVSMSWSGSEYSGETGDDVHFNVAGVTFVAASGDSGYSGGPQYPAASPYVVGVGGTTLTVNSSTGAWVSETAWSGSGGGVSTYEAEPSYQGGYQSTGKRGIPDVAYDGNPSSGVPAYNSYNCGFACYTGWNQWGGTSIGTPQWAGLFAIVNSVRHAFGKATLTQPQFLLYPASEGDYHDITSGTNGSCGTYCTAAPGYDFVTGVGSPQANLLIPALVSAP